MNTLAVYLLSALLLLIAALVFFRAVGRRDYRRRGRLTPLSLVGETLIFFAWGGFPYIYGPRDWPAVHVAAPVNILGFICLWGGLAVMFAGMAQLGPRRFLGWGGDGLRQDGLYRLSRNPQILGCGLYGVGFAVLWPSWYALGWVILYAVIAHTMVLTEEEHLRRAFGAEYERYCQRVPRYAGFPRRPRGASVRRDG